MKHFNSKLAVLVLLGLGVSCTSAYAQEVHGEPNVWFLLLLNHELNDHWNVGTELHMRYDDYLNESQQLLFRPYIDYMAKSKDVVYTFGYTYIKTFPYGDYPLAIEKPEHNIWEQVTLKHEVNKLSISHRFRLEQRWQAVINYDDTDDSYFLDGTSFGSRFRYRLTLTHPINEKFFVNIFDELWIKSDSPNMVLYDRNWIYTALGYNLSNSANVQLAYLHQYAYNNPTRYERHHGLQITGSVKF
ncbi:MAG: DUF2490 domain-containing protein [Marinoscillum sp.]